MSSVDSGHGESYQTPTRIQKRFFLQSYGSSKRSLFKPNGNNQKHEPTSDAESDIGPMSPLASSEKSSIDSDSSPGRVYESPFTSPEKTPRMSLSWDRLRPSPKKDDSPNKISRFSSLKQLTKESRSSPRRRIFFNSPQASPKTPDCKDQENINPKTPEMIDFINNIIPETPHKSANSTPQKDPERKLTTPLGSVFKETPNPPPRRKSACKMETNSSEGSSPDVNKNSLKRHSSSSCYPSAAKFIKIEDGSSRVRASLFKEIENEENQVKVTPLSAKSFYKNIDTNKRHSFGFGGKPTPEVEKKKKRQSFPSQNKRLSSGSSRRFKSGEINAGVRHGIKRPKSKRSIDKKNSSISNAVSPKDSSFKEEKSRPTASTKSSEVPQDVHMEEKPSANENIPNSIYAKPVIKQVEVIVDPTKRFFKTNRTIQQNHVATVTVSNQIKLKVADGKIALSQNKQKRFAQKRVESSRLNTEPVVKKPKLDISEFDATDLTVDEPALETSEAKNNLSGILKVLEDDWASDEFDTMETLTNSVHKNQQSPLKSKFPSDYNMLLSPGTVLSSMTSSMNIKDQVISNVQDKVEAPKEAPKPNTPKLFPVFMKGHPAEDTSEKKSKVVKRPVDWQLSAKLNGDANQYQIDAGQKQFGSTYCNECGIVYQIGEPEDENSHMIYHNSTKVMKFNGWKNERVVYHDPFSKSRIIVVEPKDPKICWKKVDDVLSIIDKELGLSDIDTTDYHSKKILLYVRDKTVIGLLAAESVKVAYRMISELIDFNCCSEEPVPAQCGINVIWTAMNYRRKGIATKMVDILRYNYCYGCILSLNDIAFSIPTPRGKLFAQKYVGTKNFLVYN